MQSLIIIVHVLAAIGITGLVLIQQGKGADMGASFGSGASQTLFGSVGSGNALTKSTSWLAVLFFATSLGLAMFARQQASQGVSQGSLIENVEQLEAAPAAGLDNDLPAAPADAGAADTDLPALPADQAPDAALQQAVEEVVNMAEQAVEELDAAADSDAAAGEQQ